MTNLFKGIVIEYPKHHVILQEILFTRVRVKQEEYSMTEGLLTECTEIQYGQGLTKATS